MDVITYPCWDWSSSILVKGAPGGVTQQETKLSTCISKGPNHALFELLIIGNNIVIIRKYILHLYFLLIAIIFSTGRRLLPPDLTVFSRTLFSNLDSKTLVCTN